MKDIYEEAANLIGEHVAVSYNDPESRYSEDGLALEGAMTYQVDGTLTAITPDATEGVYLIVVEVDPTDEEVQVRAIPLDWVVDLREGAE